MMAPNLPRPMRTTARCTQAINAEAINATRGNASFQPHYRSRGRSTRVCFCKKTELPRGSGEATGPRTAEPKNGKAVTPGASASNRALVPTTTTTPRRQAAVGGALTVTLLGGAVLLGPQPRAAHAEPQPDLPEVTTAGAEAWNVYTSDDLSPGRPYALEWPAGWIQNNLTLQGRSYGVDCSFYNPRDRAVTLAVFTKSVPGVRSIEGEGSLRAVAEQIASAAPGQKNVGQRRRSMMLNSGKQLTVYEVETEVGGGTAGRFGSAVELLAIVVADEREYTVRATASGGSWKEVSSLLRQAVRSFHFI